MGQIFSHMWDQSFGLPKPVLTELPDQRGRVFIVTGGYAGVGLELSKILYRHHGTIYLAGRSESKARSAIEAIKADSPSSDGRLEFLQLDLADLSTIKRSAEAFLSKETRLDVLTNNAGVMDPRAGSTSAQGHELHMATNVLGAFLFTKLLLPLLQRTAASAPAGSVRVTWAASLVVDAYSPTHGVAFTAAGEPEVQSNNALNYGQSKAANYFLAAQFAKRYPLAATKVIHNAWNPGNLKSELQRHAPAAARMVINVLLLYPTVYGAYTELYAGWADEAGKPERHGKYVIPWGRFGEVRTGVEEGLKEGGAAEKLWAWCEKETKAYGYSRPQSDAR